MTLQEIANKIEELEARATAMVDAAEKASSTEEIAEFRKAITEDIQPQLATLTAERDARLREEEFKSLQGTVTTLEEALKDMRSGFPVAASEGKGVVVTDEGNPYATGEHSFYQDIRMANKGRADAIERLAKGSGFEGKAMSEGVAAQGGYLVQRAVERQIVEGRELDNVLRGLCSKLNVTTNEVEFNSITLGTTAGWVAELATKPESTSMALTTVTASVFTAAGLATISNQLLADSNPAVDQLVTRDLAKRLVALEETAFLAGTGTGQPLGILNTPGVLSETVTSTDPTDLTASILAAIMQVQTEHGQPTAIVMHPRTWTRILQERDNDGRYLISPESGVQDPRSAYGRGPQLSLWGVRVVLSNRIPTNLGAGTNESRIIVGDFSEALILDRQGITVDESPHVYFTSNQTVFRAEQRVGFTAARQPKAFCVMGGVGLAAG